MVRAPSSDRSGMHGGRASWSPRLLAVALLLATVVAACGAAKAPDARVSTAGDARPTSTVVEGGAPPTTTAAARGTADDDGDGVVRVVLWGDSIAFEARESFLLALSTYAGVSAETRTMGGVAICDYLDEIARRAAEVEVALLEFSGNALWTCMVDPVTGVGPRGQAVVHRYEADLEAAVGALLAGGARIVLIGAPPAGFEPPDGERNEIRSMYERVAALHDDVTFVDAGAAVLEGGRYTDTLPCLPFEDPSLGCTPDGRIAVRGPDQLHLCPSSHPPDPFVGRCDVWPSGAYRYGQVMARAALDAADVVKM